MVGAHGAGTLYGEMHNAGKKSEGAHKATGEKSNAEYRCDRTTVTAMLRVNTGVHGAARGGRKSDVPQQHTMVVLWMPVGLV